MYKVTVVIPTYNTGDFLKPLMDSISHQTLGFKSIEILIVDDSSTDLNTLKLIQKYESQFENCRAIFLGENHDFPGYARNVGLKEATGEAIIFADHDDTYEVDAFEKLYSALSLNNADMVFSNYYKVYSDKKVKLETAFSGENITVSGVCEDLRLLELSPSIWTKLFRREFLLENNIKFPEGILAEDLYVFIYSILVSSKTVYLDDFYSYNYNIRDSSHDKSTIHLRNIKIFESMIKGYFETYNMLVDLDFSEYFTVIFKNHFIYFITSVITSDLAISDKIELFKKVRVLLVKFLEVNGDFGEKLYDPLVEPILKEDYDTLAGKIKYLKFRRSLRNIFKGL